MSHLQELRALKNQIVISRDKVDELWTQRGHIDADVLAASVQLDQLINRYHRIIYLKQIRKFASD